MLKINMDVLIYFILLNGICIIFKYEDIFKMKIIIIFNFIYIFI